MITATATQDATGSTSEFSACVTLTARTPGDVDGNGVVDFADLLTVLGSWGAVRATARRISTATASSISPTSSSCWRTGAEPGLVGAVPGMSDGF